VTGPRGADGSLRANRFGSVATKHVGVHAVCTRAQTAYVVALPDLPSGGSPSAAAEQLAVGLEHLALDWFDADAAPGEARLVGRQQRLVEQTADPELVARLLAEPGVDPNASTCVSAGHGDLDHYTPLTRAAELGHLEAVRLLLDAGADPGRADGDGATALMLAAGEGQLEVLRLLLVRGAAVDAAQPDGGWTAFHYACYNNQPECVEELARVGCDIRIKDSNGFTGRELVEAKGHGEVVVRLRAVAAKQPRAVGPALEPELARRGADRLEPELVTAANQGNGAAVARLLAAGADPNASVPGRMPSGEVVQSTALCEAAVHGHLEAVRLLLDGGADPSSAGSKGATPLINAAGGGQLEVLRLLLGRGAVVDAAQPAYGYTAFHCACERNHAECAEELVRAGCDVGIKNENGLIGREIAKRYGHRRLLARLDALGGKWAPGGGEAQALGAK
jgi:ankyrin repeat protein